MNLFEGVAGTPRIQPACEKIVIISLAFQLFYAYLCAEFCKQSDKKLNCTVEVCRRRRVTNRRCRLCRLHYPKISRFRIFVVICLLISPADNHMIARSSLDSESVVSFTSTVSLSNMLIPSVLAPPSSIFKSRHSTSLRVSLPSN